MEKNARSKIALPPVSQIGIVVKDAQKAADHYSATFGIGPFNIQDIEIQGATLRGKPAATAKLRIALGQTGTIQIEFIQVLEGGELYTEFLKSKGEGLHHLGIYVEDFDTFNRLLNELEKEGIKPLFVRKGRASGFAYLDTQAVGGAILELMNPPKKDSKQ